MYRVLLKSAVCLAALSVFTAPAKAVEVYMFKGAGDFSFVNENMHFSLGLNKMADALNAEGIKTEVNRFGAMDRVLQDIRQRKPRQIALVGHSMGALASMAMARNLKGSDIEIVYMALLDIPGPVGIAGDNVEWVENYYTINPVYARLTNVRSHPKAENIHVSGYIHNRLDDAPKVQNGVLAAIREVHARDAEPLVPEQPETLYVQQPVTQPDPQTTASVEQRLQVPEAQPQSVGVGPQPVPAYQPPQPQAQIVQPVQPQAAPLQPLATGDPYALPSVRPQASVGIEPYGLSSEPQPAIDPVTTASTPQPSIVDSGRSLLSKAGSFLRSRASGSKRRVPDWQEDR